MSLINYTMKATKTCYVDANVLIYFHSPRSSFHKQAVSIVKALIKQGYVVYISSLVIDEYLYNSFRLPKDEQAIRIVKLNQGMKKIFHLPGVQLLNPPLKIKKHFAILRFMKKYNLKPRDAYHLFIMRENKIRYFVTFDDDFNEVFDKGLVKRMQVADPIKEGHGLIKGKTSLTETLMQERRKERVKGEK